MGCCLADVVCCFRTPAIGCGSSHCQTSGKYTLPQLIGDQYGKEAKIIASFVIPVAWIGVIAAQMIGGAKVMNSFFGLPYEGSVWGIGILFIFYTAIGGQVSVIKQIWSSHSLSFWGYWLLPVTFSYGNRLIRER